MKLTENQKIMLEHLALAPVGDGWTFQNKFYRFGGYGYVPIRFSRKLLPKLAEMGLVKSDGSNIWKITDAGREAVGVARKAGA